MIKILSIDESADVSYLRFRRLVRLSISSVEPSAFLLEVQREESEQRARVMLAQLLAEIQKPALCCCKLLRFRHFRRVSSTFDICYSQGGDFSVKVPLLQYSAEHSFWDLPASVLELLAKEECGTKVDAPKDQQLGELTRTCIEKTLKVSSTKAAEIMENNLHFRYRDADELDALLNHPEFTDLVQARNKKEIQETLDKARAAERSFLDIAGTIGRIRKKTEKATGKSKRKPVSFESTKVFDKERVTALLPDNFYRCHRDDFSKCWRITHRSGWSVSRSWGMEGDERVPIRLALLKAWERHVLFHPNCSCPFDFQEVLQ